MADVLASLPHRRSRPKHTASDKGFDPTAEARLRRLVESVHQLGPAPLLHLLREIDGGADLERTLQRYAALPAGFIRDMGADRFVQSVHMVHGGAA